MQHVLKFWFETLLPSDWYKKSDALDATLLAQFEATHRAIVAGETSAWRERAEGRLAEIIVLDQFSRNMFRGTPQSFQFDPLALALAQEAVLGGHDQKLNEIQRAFLYMPFMHSESRQIHETAMILFRDLPNLAFEIKHKAIIDQFGRYPHRNAILNRTSTPEEIEWMQTHQGF